MRHSRHSLNTFAGAKRGAHARPTRLPMIDAETAGILATNATVLPRTRRWSGIDWTKLFVRSGDTALRPCVIRVISLNTFAGVQTCDGFCWLPSVT
jgi:hypothetical protein